MTPAQLQEICIEAEDLRHRVQTAYRKRELTDEDAKYSALVEPALRMMVAAERRYGKPDYMRLKLAAWAQHERLHALAWPDFERAVKDATP